MHSKSTCLWDRLAQRTQSRTHSMTSNLGCVFLSGKLKSKNNLHPGMCLAPLENAVKLRIEFSLTVKLATQLVESFQPSFYLQLIFVFPHPSHTSLTWSEYSTFTIHSKQNLSSFLNPMHQCVCVRERERESFNCSPTPV